MQRKRMMYRRRKRKAFFWAMLLVFSTIFAAFCLSSNADTEVEYVTVMVEPGDTLWSIAEENNPRGKDIRKLIKEIKDVNGISSTIHPDELLEIPY